MTPAFTITITADNIDGLHANLRDLLPHQLPADVLRDMDIESLLIRVADRLESEGYEMEAWKKGERDTKPAEELPPAARKKEEARAKLRGDLAASLADANDKMRGDLNAIAEATHAPAVVKEDVDPAEETPPEVKAKKTKAPAKANGKAETPDALKARTIIKLQELYSAGKKAEVNKLLAQYGDGSKTFSSIPAEQFGPIAEAAEAI